MFAVTARCFAYVFTVSAVVSRFVAEETSATKAGRRPKRPADTELLGRFRKRAEASPPAEELEADAAPHAAPVAPVPPVEKPVESWWGVLSGTVSALVALPEQVRHRGGLRQTLWAECVRIRRLVIDRGLKFAPPVLAYLVELEGPRREYFQRDIEIMLNIDRAVRGAHGTAVDVATAINTVHGYELVSPRNISRWRLLKQDIEDGKERRLRGRKADRKFERSVMSKLVVFVAANEGANEPRAAVVGVDDDIFVPLNEDDESGEEQMASEEPEPVSRCVVKENIAYSFALVKRAGLLAQKEFPLDLKIQGLQFSSRWAQGFLRRNLFTRQKVVTDAKAWPTITGKPVRSLFICFSAAPNVSTFDHFAHRNQ